MTRMLAILAVWAVSVAAVAAKASDDAALARGKAGAGKAWAPYVVEQGGIVGRNRPFFNNRWAATAGRCCSPRGCGRGLNSSR